MDNATYQKIIEHWGWDYCEHDRVRRFCEECKWDVPAYMRQKKGTGRANSRSNNAQFQSITGKKACQSPGAEHPDFSDIA